MGDQRLVHRTNIMARAEVAWVDSSGNERMLVGMLEETSPHGACLRVNEPIAVGSKIAVKWRREEFSGIVRHYKRQNSEYIVGIQREMAASARRPS